MHSSSACYCLFYLKNALSAFDSNLIRWKDKNTFVISEVSSNFLKIRLQIFPSMRWEKLNQYGRKCVIDDLNNRNATKKISFSSLLLMILTKEEIYPKREKTMTKLLGVENKTWEMFFLFKMLVIFHRTYG